MNKTEQRRFSTPARILIIAAVVVAAVLALMFAAQTWLKHKVVQIVREMPIDVEGRSFAVGLDNARVSLPSRTVVLKGVVLIPSKGASGNGPSANLRVGIGRISAEGISYKKGRRGEKPALSLRALRITNPSVEYAGIERPDAGPDGGFRLDSLPRVVSRTFRELKANIVAIEGADIAISIWKNREKQDYVIAGLDALFEEVDLTGPQSGEEILFSRRVGIEFGKLSYGYKGGANVMELDSLSADSEEGLLTLGTFRITPQYEEDEFARRTNSDWTMVEMGPLAGYGIDFHAILAEGLITADSILIPSAMLDSYKNRQIERPAKVKPLLYEPIQRLPVGLDIPLVRIGDMDVTYRELAPGAMESGVIRYNSMSASVTGLTNRPSNREQMIVLEARGKWMGVADSHSRLLMPADSLNDRFEIIARVQPMEMNIMNGVSIPLADIRIDSGATGEINLHLTASSSNSQVEISMPYEDLHITLLRKDYTRRGFISMLANGVLKSDNPAPDGHLRVGEGEATRDPQRSFFNYLWRSILAGVTKIVI